MVIESCGNLRWRVAVPLGRDSVIGKPMIHTKALRGSKKDAQAYVDWITGMVAAGQAVTITVAQSELRQLQDLQHKADKLRATLQAAVRDGAIVEPGALELPAPAAGVVLPEKRRPRAVTDPETRRRNQELLRPLFR